MDLIADVGGTNTRCALVGANGLPVQTVIYQNAGYQSLLAVLTAYLRAEDAAPNNAAIAVAAPVTGDNVRMTNRQWHFSIEELRHDLGVSRLQTVNDFTAIAMSLPRLDDADTVSIGGGQAVAGKAMAVLGPGTGLGVSGLVPGTQGWAPIAGEGGHVTLASGNARESQVIDAIAKLHGHCSAERLVSGPGLATTYDTLRTLAGAAPLNPEPAEISARADAGDPVAEEALALFFGLLGSVAGNLALTLGALGGVFIGGGVAPKLLDRLPQSSFRQRFEAKGRYTGYMQSIPTRVITHPTPALIGLASLV